MNLTNEELIRAVDNDPHATLREKELVTRLDELQTEINMINHVQDETDELKGIIEDLETKLEELQK